MGFWGAFSIGLVTGLSLMWFVFVKLMRRHYQQVATIRQSREEVQELISRIYHKDLFPEICRGEGLFNVARLQVRQALEDVDMAERPNHYRYMSLVRKQLQDMDKEILIPGITEMQRLKKRFKDILDRYYSEN